MGRVDIKLWCIIRMAASSTLSLFDSLTSAGFNVWTPIETKRRRANQARDRIDVRCPMMPTYIFAEAESLPNLLTIAMLPSKDHRDFSVMRCNNRFPLIADACLSAVRLEERRVKPKPDLPTFAPGTTVRLAEGGFAGMSGVVEATAGNFVLVAFPHTTMPPIKIASWWLLPDQEESVMDRAA